MGKMDLGTQARRIGRKYYELIRIAAIRARYIGREYSGWLRLAAVVMLAALLLLAVFPQLGEALKPIWATARVPKKLNIESIDWTGVGAIATILTFTVNLILLASVWHGFNSVKEGQASRSADVLAWASEQMDKVKADERVLRMAPADIALWDDTVRKSANRVCNAYQRLCYYARKGLIERRHFRDMWGVNICIYWRILEPYIASERMRFGDRPTGYHGAYLRADFEILARSFIRHFNRRLPGLLDRYGDNAGGVRGPTGDLTAALALFREATPGIPDADAYEYIMRDWLSARGFLETGTPPAP